MMTSWLSYTYAIAIRLHRLLAFFWRLDWHPLSRPDSDSWVLSGTFGDGQMHLAS